MCDVHRRLTVAGGLNTSTMTFENDYPQILFESYDTICQLAKQRWWYFMQNDLAMSLYSFMELIHIDQ